MTTAIAKTTAQTIQSLITSNMGEIAKLVPKHITPDRLLKVLMSSMAKTPALGQCTPASLVGAFRVAAELGLEPGGALGHLYLVPYGPVCTPIVGYRGLIELMRRSGELASIRCVVVHEKDHFEFSEGIEQTIVHRPNLSEDPGPLVYAYMVAKLKDGGVQLEVMNRAQIEAVRNRSKAGQSGPWKTDYDEMAKKTVLRRGSKYLPMSSERFSTAMEVDDREYIEGEVVQAEVAEQTATQKAKAAVKAKRLEMVDVPPEPPPLSAEEMARESAIQAEVEAKTNGTAPF